MVDASSAAAAAAAAAAGAAVGVATLATADGELTKQLVL